MHAKPCNLRFIIALVLSVCPEARLVSRRESQVRLCATCLPARVYSFCSSLGRRTEDLGGYRWQSSAIRDHAIVTMLVVHGVRA